MLLNSWNTPQPTGKALKPFAGNVLQTPNKKNAFKIPITFSNPPKTPWNTPERTWKTLTSPGTPLNPLEHSWDARGTLWNPFDTLSNVHCIAWNVPDTHWKSLKSLWNFREHPWNPSKNLWVLLENPETSRHTYEIPKIGSPCGTPLMWPWKLKPIPRCPLHINLNLTSPPTPIH